jgi:hypothetical protein
MVVVSYQQSREGGMAGGNPLEMSVLGSTFFKSNPDGAP